MTAHRRSQHVCHCTMKSCNGVSSRTPNATRTPLTSCRRAITSNRVSCATAATPPSMNLTCRQAASQMDRSLSATMTMTFRRQHRPSLRVLLRRAIRFPGYWRWTMKPRKFSLAAWFVALGPFDLTNAHHRPFPSDKSVRTTHASSNQPRPHQSCDKAQIQHHKSPRRTSDCDRSL